MSYEAWRARRLSELDPGIVPYVDALRAQGVETSESCEDADEHAYPQPTVSVVGEQSEGLRALAVALRHGFPVRTIRGYWVVRDGQACGPDWEMMFCRPRAACLAFCFAHLAEAATGAFALYVMLFSIFLPSGQSLYVW
jgi:hypothetical protein